MLARPQNISDEIFISNLKGSAEFEVGDYEERGVMSVSVLARYSLHSQVCKYPGLLEEMLDIEKMMVIT